MRWVRRVRLDFQHQEPDLRIPIPAVPGSVGELGSNPQMSQMDADGARRRPTKLVEMTLHKFHQLLIGHDVGGAFRNGRVFKLR